MLFIIPTPIGNLKDISQRIIETLKDCDIVFSEDTRITLNLFNHLNINKKILRYNDHLNKNIDLAISFLKSGKKVCLLSDAGMPVISDPGFKLVKEAIKMNIKIEVLPGPSAFSLALAGSGYGENGFIFLGFLPRTTSKIKKILNESFSLNLPIVLYESPYRIKDFLNILKDFYFDIDVVIARELTKIFEEWIRGNPKEILEKIKDKEIKGEITIVLSKKENHKEGLNKILYVCEGNTCRSVLAEYYSKKNFKNVDFFSSGLNVNTDLSLPEEVKKILNNEGIEDINHIPKQLEKSDIEKADLVLCMTKRQKDILIGFFPESEYKIYLISSYAGFGSIDIEDPYSKSYDFYLMMFKTLKNFLNSVFQRLKNNTI